MNITRTWLIACGKICFGLMEKQVPRRKATRNDISLKIESMTMSFRTASAVRNLLLVCGFPSLWADIRLPTFSDALKLLPQSNPVESRKPSQERMHDGIGTQLSSRGRP